VKLPSWANELRPTQTSAIDQILEDFQTNSIVFLEAPTGTGKTLIADIVRQNIAKRAVYVCSSISLQDQFLKDFPDAALLKGRSNYPTLDYPQRYVPTNPTLGLSCADCTKHKVGDEMRCDWCEVVQQCPYEGAKITAIRSDLVCANSYYFLYEANYVGALSKRDLVIIDEIDTIESILMSFIEVNISEYRIKEFNLPHPERKTVSSTWLAWAEEAYDIAKKQKRPYQQERLFDSEPDLKALRSERRLTSLLADLKRLLDPDWGLATDNWVYDGYSANHIIFKPITVAPYAAEYLWRHGKRFLCMSATIISATELADSLGLLSS